ncbi:MAG: PilZ domain-containing protein [Candidatus Delongbacteria bacterium]|nr:PilZ domain-containing protein [Candidatus Delongbacteria bacterium]
MLFFSKQAAFSKKLDRIYHLTPAEIDLVFKILALLSNDKDYPSILNKKRFDHYISSLHGMEPLPGNFPGRDQLENHLLSIQRKLFPEEIQNLNPESTRELLVNTPVYIIFYRLNRINQGVVLENHPDHLDIRLKDWDCRQDIELDRDEILIRIQWDNKGVYECLTHIKSYCRQPFPMLQIDHHPLIHQERRRYIRYQIEMETQFCFSTDGDHDKKTISSVIDNISVGGAQFTSHQYLDEGIVMSVNLPFGTQALDLPLKVIHRRFDLNNKQYIYHAMFQGITADESLRLEHFIKFYREAK